MNHRGRRGRRGAPIADCAPLSTSRDECFGTASGDHRAPNSKGVPFTKNPGSWHLDLSLHDDLLCVLCVLCGFNLHPEWSSGQPRLILPLADDLAVPYLIKVDVLSLLAIEQRDVEVRHERAVEHALREAKLRVLGALEDEDQAVAHRDA